MENALIKLCNTSSGIRQEQMEAALINDADSPLTILHLANAINNLTNQGRLSVFRTDGICVWKTVAEDKANKLSSMTAHERIVYAAVEKEGSRGIWIKDLRKRTNISGQNTLEKILKSMMVRKLIKSERSVAGKNKKVFMLYDLKPSLEVTGGTWYRGHEMDVEFIVNMQKACRILLSNLGPMTSAQVMLQLQMHKITTVPFTLADVSTVLNTMWLDRSVELVSPQHFTSETMKKSYNEQKDAKERALLLREERQQRQLELASRQVKRQKVNNDDDFVEPELDEADDDEYDDEDEDDYRVYKVVTQTSSYQNQAAMANPCMSCPMLNVCAPGNLIEPQTCIYMQQWLEDGF